MENNKKNSNFKFQVPNWRLILKRLVYYIKVWWMMSKNSFLIVLSQKKVLIIFLTGKILRFFMFFMFLKYLVLGSSGIAGYNSDQIIFFFLTFNLIDVVTQFLFREVYRFRNLVVSGDLDLIIVKPYSTLFRTLMGGADVIDLLTIPPLLFAIVFFGGRLEPSAFQILTYLILSINGFLVATSFHIFVLGMAIITMEIDHSIMIYRDIVSLGRLPIDIYKAPLGTVLTYLLPVGIMITFPVKGLLGTISLWGIFLCLLVGLLSIFFSVRFWGFALKKYTSASS